eukprot:CAMPEP_0117006254 /NCGR_PEP_ID=MMETSP0472-20121206/6547_1 /TAXON_ID=693140 ORGANISM="Tiarina fusus, Strain LIS" /NCGR_SAMPLE_ID=MMETSP0472 /ASSEMBLY_ACC=CAM_ASM_000603 /LENGTH=1519 /DNA_ID=CAMNT_0004707665 /DNA_START=104 /DNA_END=4663 /DNA_ORIENTATION=-
MAPECPEDCSCDTGSNPTLGTSGNRLENAWFTPPAAGRYTVRMGVQSRCGWSQMNLTVDAKCSKQIPGAMITAPAQGPLCSTPVLAGVEMQFQGVATPPSGVSYNSLNQCWCITKKPTGSTNSIVNGTGLTPRFTPDKSGDYTIRLSVYNGCSRNVSYITFTAECGCKPVASAGTVLTPTYTGHVPAATTTQALNAGFSYDAENHPLTYDWSLQNWTSLNGMTIQNTTAGVVKTYTFKPPLLGNGFGKFPGSPMVTTNTTVSFVNTSTAWGVTWQNVLQSYPIGSNKAIGQILMDRYPLEDTSSWVTKTNTTMLNTVVTAQTFADVTPKAAACTVKIYNYTKVNAMVQAYPFVQCLGIFRFRITTTDVCGSSYDDLTWSVKCGLTPVVKLQCKQYTAFNYTSKAFTSVVIDGRSSSPDTQLNATWTKLSGTGVLTGTGFRLASFTPTGAGTSTVQLALTDGCTTGMNTVQIETVCPRNLPATVTGTTLVSPATTTWNRNGWPQDLIAQVNVAADSGVPASEFNSTQITFTYKIQNLNTGTNFTTYSKKGNELIPVYSGTTITNYIINVTQHVQLGGQYALYVTASDGCKQKSWTINLVTLTCSNGVTAPVAIPTMSCMFDATQAKFNILFNATRSTGARALNYTWVPVTNFVSSNFSTNQGMVVFHEFVSPPIGQTYSPTTYAARLSVFDGCTTSPAVETSVQCTCTQRTGWYTAPGVTNLGSVSWSGMSNGTLWWSYWPSKTINTPANNGATLMAGESVTWSLTGPNPNQNQLTTSDGMKNVTFTPTTYGTYNIRWTYKNNCTGIVVYTYTIQADCTFNTVPTIATTPATTVSYDPVETQFNMVNFKATWGNNGQDVYAYPKITYTWEMLDSPVGSTWGKTTANYMTTSTSNAVTSAGATTNSATNTTTMSTVTTTVVTTMVAQRAVLPNHGIEPYYADSGNKRVSFAQTCFRPDIRGPYTVRLTMNDGCRTRSITQQIMAQCAGGLTTFTLSTSQTPTAAVAGSRVTLFAQGDTNFRANVPAHGVSWKWEVMTTPCGSGLMTATNTSGTGLMNSQGATASFVPDVPGTYMIRIRATDFCVSQTKDVTVNVGCPANDDTTSLPLDPAAKCGLPPPSNPLPPNMAVYANNYTVVSNTNGMFARVNFTGLELVTKAQCKNPLFSWAIVAKTCVAPQPPAPPPPPPAAGVCSTIITYNWTLVRAPCTSSFANGTKFFTLQNYTDLPFTPDVKGTYHFLFTVTDGCSTSTKNVTLVTKCEKTPTASLAKTKHDALLCDNQAESAAQMSTGTYLNVFGPQGGQLDMVSDAQLDACPVFTPAPVNTTCGKKLCVCHESRCEAVRKTCNCAPCCCAGDPVCFPTSSALAPIGGFGTTGSGSGVSNSGGNTTGVGSAPSSGGSAPSGGSSPSGGHDAHTNHTNNATSGSNGTTTVSKNDPSSPVSTEDTNGIDPQQYDKELRDAKDKYDKYLTAIWAGTMTPLGAGLIASVGYNSFVVVKYKSLLFPNSGGGGGVEMSEAPALSSV